MIGLFCKNYLNVEIARILGDLLYFYLRLSAERATASISPVSCRTPRYLSYSSSPQRGYGQNLPKLVTKYPVFSPYQNLPMSTY